MFVDMHHHLIYGIDDGAQTIEDMKNMILTACRNGAEEIVATPHATPGREEFPGETYLSPFRMAHSPSAIMLLTATSETSITAGQRVQSCSKKK